MAVSRRGDHMLAFGSITEPEGKAEMVGKADQGHRMGRNVSRRPSRTRDRRTRKVFVRASLDSRRTYISGAAIAQVVAKDFIHDLRFCCPGISAVERELLQQLFFVGGNGNYTSLLPSDDHPGKPLRSWQPFYELEMDVAQTYASRFFRDTHFYPVKGYPRLRQDDDVVIIGSQVSNLAARILLGRADRQEPVFRVAHGKWRTELRWNLFTPENAPRTKIQEFRGPRESSAHVIYERGNPVPYQSETDSARTRYLDDYLLVTMIPRARGKKQRALVFAGLHGAGARAVDLILREPPSDLLQEAARQSAGAPYFQVLLHVTCVTDARGESFPCGLELIGACPLTVE
jgi:hypothetical protein